MDPLYTLKPNKTAFLYYPLLLRILTLLIVSIVVSAFGFTLIWAVFVVVALIMFWARSVRYKKEKYEFYNDKLIRYGGGIFNSTETELVFRNLTNVICVLPFISHGLFKTGVVHVNSAGSGVSEIFLRHVDTPKKFYKYVEDLAKYNGFSLAQKELVREDKPNGLAVFFNALRRAGAVPFYAAVYLLIIVFEGGFSFAEIGEFIAPYIPPFLGLLIALFVFAFMLLPFLFSYLDLKKRKYYVYNDTITSEGGWLTKRFSFIPFENLSDTSLTQTFIDRLFGLYDVKVSCQGAGQEIHFLNIVEGKELQQALDDLLQKKPVLGKAKTSEKVATTAKVSAAPVAAKKVANRSFDTKFTGEYRIHGPRAYFFSLLFVPVILFMAIFQLWAPLGGFVLLTIVFIVFIAITISVTKFFINENTVGKNVTFLTQKNLEFSYEKVTAVVIKENFIDKWYGTCSIQFLSVGSREKLSFSMIKKQSGLYESILKKVAITAQNQYDEMPSQYSFGASLGALLPLTIIGILWFAGSVFAALVSGNPIFYVMPVLLILAAVGLYLWNRYYYARSTLKFYDDCLYIKKGVFFVREYYMQYDYIKDIATVKYPGSSKGKLIFNIAGGSVVENKHGNQTVVSNEASIDYVQNISEKDELLDQMFLQLPTKATFAQFKASVKQQEASFTSKPAIANFVVSYLIFSVFTFFLAPLHILMFIGVIWYLKSVHYRIEETRVVKRSGIFYKRQKSVLFSKIDHINIEQNVLNKLFSNATITVNTIGSSLPEMQLRNLKHHKEFYEKLKEKY